MAEELYIYACIYKKRPTLFNWVQWEFLVQNKELRFTSVEIVVNFFEVWHDERDFRGCVRQNLTDQTSDELKKEHQSQ